MVYLGDAPFPSAWAGIGKWHHILPILTSRQWGGSFVTNSSMSHPCILILSLQDCAVRLKGNKGRQRSTPSALQLGYHVMMWPFLSRQDASVDLHEESNTKGSGTKQIDWVAQCKISTCYIPSTYAVAICSYIGSCYLSFHRDTCRVAMSKVMQSIFLHTSSRLHRHGRVHHGTLTCWAVARSVFFLVSGHGFHLLNPIFYSSTCRAGPHSAPCRIILRQAVIPLIFYRTHP